MLRLILLTIFLISSPVFGLIETLYETEHRCYSGCVSHYGSVGMKLNACKTGCFFKLHRENCADQCKLHSIHEQVQASCVMGCAMIHAPHEESVKGFRPKTVIVIHKLVKPSHDETPKDLKDLLLREEEEKHDHLEKIIEQIRLKWKHLTPKESKCPAWILFSLFLLTSVILWYLIVSLCHNRPRRHLHQSISTEELIFDKENPPIKIKLTNI